MSERRYDYKAVRIQQQASMSSQVVARKDKEYALYSGASFEIAMQMARIDAILKAHLLPAKYIPVVKLKRLLLDQQRKAFFASVGTSEISKLGFLLGIDRKELSATKP
jgi:hypothetical protein